MLLGPIQSVDPTNWRDVMGTIACVALVMLAWGFYRVLRRKPPK